MKAAIAALAVATGAGLMAGEADARPGKGFSYGSRGSRTYSTPSATPTAPGAAQPMQKSMTQNGQPAAAQAARPNVAQAAPARSSMFRNLFLGGLIGAGLASIFGVGAFASVLGFLLQTLLIGGLIYIAIAFFRSRSSTATAGGPGYGSAQRAAYQQAGMNGAAGGAAAGASAAQADLKLAPADFDAFERLLGEIQTAYGRDDRRALETRTTPEMLSYFAEELADNRRRGVENKISDVKLLQGDLSEAWSEADQDYATVAMRYRLTDVTVESRTGRVVDGSQQPTEATELWTFVRRRGAGPAAWELSAIQQT